VLTALVLVCSMQAAACSPDLARMVVRVPEPSALPFLCLRNGQAYLAGSGLEVGSDEFVRVVCVHERRHDRADRPSAVTTRLEPADEAGGPDRRAP
jgi:hypothetical protein